jgi:hypothetical protein
MCPLGTKEGQFITSLKERVSLPTFKKDSSPGAETERGIFVFRPAFSKAS